MQQAKLSRTDFLSWISEGQSVSELWNNRYSPEAASVTIAWDFSETTTDPVIVVPAAEMREFLAFTATYLTSYSPFTAFFRVIPTEFLSMVGGQSLLQRRRIDPLIGVGIAEAAMQMQSAPTKPGDISIQACLATGSSVVIQALTAGFEPDLSVTLLERWGEVRSILNPQSESGLVRVLKEFWANFLPAVIDLHVMHRAESNVTVSEFCDAALKTNGQGDSYSFSKLWRGNPNADRIFSNLQASREIRVQTLLAISKEPTLSNLPASVRDVIIGFAAAQVGEGSLSYFSLLQGLIPSPNASLLWYGAFSGMRETSEILNGGDCLGRRVSRAISGGGLKTLSADIAYEEFLLFNSSKPPQSFRTDFQSVLEVELFPGVSGRFRQVREARPTEDPVKIQRTMRELRNLTEHMTYIIDSTMNEKPERQESFLAELFPKKSVPQKTSSPSRRRK